MKLWNELGTWMRTQELNQVVASVIAIIVTLGVTYGAIGMEDRDFRITLSAAFGGVVTYFMTPRRDNNGEKASGVSSSAS